MVRFFGAGRQAVDNCGGCANHRQKNQNCEQMILHTLLMSDKLHFVEILVMKTQWDLTTN
ncbi:MAG: hypothetical protein DMF73_01550 [Acidobacteria bacterium]|nr:MAG: hypothetical protein DMF73_01550 [Acidobacteriota bacterium]